MAVGGIGSFSALTSYSGVNSSKTNSELEFDKIYQQKTDSVEINSTSSPRFFWFFIFYYLSFIKTDL